MTGARGKGANPNLQPARGYGAEGLEQRREDDAREALRLQEGRVDAAVAVADAQTGVAASAV